ATYSVYLGTSASAMNVISSGITATGFAVTTSLTAGVTYYWKVIASSSAGTAPDSATWSFTTASATSGLTAPAREYVRYGGRLVAVENSITPPGPVTLFSPANTSVG